MAAAAICSEEACVDLYRADLMQRWVVPRNSSLCSLNLPSASPDRYGLVARDGTFFASSKGISTDLDSNFVSEKRAKNRFSFCIYKPDLNFAHFVAIFPTAQTSKLHTWEHRKDAGAYAHVRSTYFVSISEIRREGQAYSQILAGVTAGIAAVILLGSIFANVLRLGCVFTSVFTLGLSHLTGFLQVTSPTRFAGILAGAALLALAFGYANLRWGNRSISIGFGATMAIYYLVGGTFEHRWFFGVASTALIIEGAVFGCTRIKGSKGERIAYACQFAVFWTQMYLLWSYWLMITPAEIYLRVYRGPKDYTVGIPGKGFSLWWWNLVTLLAALILGGICGVMRHHRDVKKTINYEQKLLA